VALAFSTCSARVAWLDFFACEADELGFEAFLLNLFQCYAGESLSVSAGPWASDDAYNLHLLFTLLL
jgi:hypothetical protein